MSALRDRRALALLRVTVAALLFVHGAARVALGIVDDFGGFFAAHGFPCGLACAWIVTLMELLGAPALAAGRFVRPLALWFATVLTAGIVLVHAPSGWFVVGAGRNGMEYSVLLVVCLLLLAWATPTRRRRRHER